MSTSRKDGTARFMVVMVDTGEKAMGEERDGIGWRSNVLQTRTRHRTKSSSMKNVRISNTMTRIPAACFVEPSSLEAEGRGLREECGLTRPSIHLDAMCVACERSFFET